MTPDSAEETSPEFISSKAGQPSFSHVDEETGLLVLPGVKRYVTERSSAKSMPTVPKSGSSVRGGNGARATTLSQGGAADDGGGLYAVTK